MKDDDIEDIKIIIGIIACIFGMFGMVIGDISNNTETMLWGMFLMLIWIKNS